MKNASRTLRFCLLALLLCGLLLPPPAFADDTTVSADEFRVKLTAYAAWLDAFTASSRAEGAPLPDRTLAARLAALSEDEFRALYEAAPDPAGLIARTEKLMAAMPAQPAPQPRTEAIAPATTTLYPPDYPSGWFYEAWLLSIRLTGILADSDDPDPDWNNDRCNYDAQATASAVSWDLETIAIYIHYGCEVWEPAQVGACAAAVIAQELAHVAQLVERNCATQGGSVDGAEVEAVYENSLLMAGLLDTAAADLGTHDATVNAKLDNTAALLAALTTQQALALRIRIEEALAGTNENRRIATFYLPQARGGLLEQVRQTVLDALTATAAAGLSVGEAQAWLARADAALAAGAYKAAFDNYAKAYREVTK